MGMQLSGAQLSEISTAVETIEQTSVRVTQFEILDHTIYLQWDKDEKNKAHIVGISKINTPGSPTRR